MPFVPTVNAAVAERKTPLLIDSPRESVSVQIVVSTAAAGEPATA